MSNCFNCSYSLWTPCLFLWQFNTTFRIPNIVSYIKIFLAPQCLSLVKLKARLEAFWFSLYEASASTLTCYGSLFVYKMLALYIFVAQRENPRPLHHWITSVWVITDPDCWAPRSCLSQHASHPRHYTAKWFPFSGRRLPPRPVSPCLHHWGGGFAVTVAKPATVPEAKQSNVCQKNAVGEGLALNHILGCVFVVACAYVCPYVCGGHTAAVASTELRRNPRRAWAGDRDLGKCHSAHRVARLWHTKPW